LTVTAAGVDPVHVVRIFVFAFVLLALGGTAYADDAGASLDRPARARQLFEEGRALLKQELFDEACRRFARSYALDRKPGTQLNLGECAERAGELRRAWLLFDDAARAYGRMRAAAEARLAKESTSVDALRDLQVAGAGERLARDRVAALVGRLGRLVVRLAEPRAAGLAIRIGDRAVPPADEIALLLDPGDVSITASVPGREPFAVKVTMVAGQPVTVEVPAFARDHDGLDTPAPFEPARSTERVRLALGLGAGGVALAAASGGLGLAARTQYRDAEARCTRDAGMLVCPQAQVDAIAAAGRKADIATYAAIAGGAFVVTAVVLYVTAPRDGVAVRPIASPEGAGVAISGRF
jgi:hypothetical protein